jgi:hypothetical protein
MYVCNVVKVFEKKSVDVQPSNFGDFGINNHRELNFLNSFKNLLLIVNNPIKMTIIQDDLKTEKTGNLKVLILFCKKYVSIFKTKAVEIAGGSVS